MGSIYETAKSQPEAVAICSWDGCFTYSEFVSAVDRVSAWLLCNGVLPGDLVPLYFEKSKWAIVAIFSIMRAGAAWVPLDFKQPFDRILEIVRETKSKHVATSKALAETFTHGAPLEPLVIDQELFDTLSPDKKEATSHVEPHQVAFIMFTVSNILDLSEPPKTSESQVQQESPAA
ncbi:MAG: hypothetical protein Q9167_004694 [Letrouitia subvulpina]